MKYIFNIDASWRPFTWLACSLIVLLGFSSSVVAQSDQHRLQFSLTTNCGAGDLDINYIYGAYSGNSLGEGMFLEAEVAAPSGSIYVSFSGICSSTGFSIELIFTQPFSFSGINCSTQSFIHIPGTGQQATLSIYHIPPRLGPIEKISGDPLGTICSDYPKLQIPVGASSYIWEKSNDNFNWLPISPSSGTSITLTADLMHDPSYGNKYGEPRYIRVKPSICSDERVAYIVGDPAIIFLHPPPSFVATPSDLSCFTSLSGTADGKITISSFVGYDPNDLYDVQIDWGGGFSISYGTFSGSALEGYQISLLEEETYQLTISNSPSKCSSVIEGLVISKPDPFIIQPLGLPNNVSCNQLDVGTKDDGSVQLTLQDGISPFSYTSPEATLSWNSSTSFTPILDGFEIGTYNITASYMNGGETCLSNSIPVSIGEPSEISLTATSVDVNCKNTNTGSINLTASGGNGGFGFAWSGPSAYTSLNEDISALYAGNYSVIVTDVKGCIDNLAKTINEPAVEIDLSAEVISRLVTGGFDMSCAQNDGAIELSVVNGQSPLTYAWTKNGIPFTPSSPTDPSDLMPALYGIAVDDNIGCHDEIVVTLNPHPGITANVVATSDYNGFNTKCPDSDEGEGFVQTVTNGVGTISYSWFDGSTNQTIQDLLPGNYLVNVTDDNGCSDDGTLVIAPALAIQPSVQITSNYNGVQISCQGANDGIMEAFPVNGFGTYTYDWDHGPTSKSVSGLAASTFAVTVTDDYGCFVKESLVISDPLAIDITLSKTDYNGSDLLCHDDANGEIQSVVTNGISPYTYSWSNGATSPDISGLATGDYTLMVTDQNNCTQTNLMTIVNPEELLLALQHVNNYSGFDISCFGLSDGAATAVLTGGTGAYSYLWSTGPTSSSISGQPAGTLSIQVQDANGCVKNGPITLTEPSLLGTTAIIDNPVSCFGGSDGQISLSGSGGAGVYQYSLDGILFQGSNIFPGLDKATYNLFIKDDNACQANVMAIMTQPDDITVSFQNIIDATCNDPIGSAQAVAAGGNSGYDYEWFDDVTNQPINAGDILVNVTAGIYRVEILDAKNCQASNLVAVSSIGGAEFDFINIMDVTCFGFSDASAEINITSGTGPFSYGWTGGQVNNTAVNLSAGNYFATVTDGLGCKTIKPIVIGTPQALVADFVKVQPSCKGDCDGVITVTASGGTQPYSYEWTSLVQTTTTVTGLCKGDYDFLLTDANNCKKIAIVQLTEPEDISIATNIVIPTCLGRCDGIIEAIPTGGNGAYQYAWLNGKTTAVNSDLCPGEFTVTVMDIKGCTATRVTVLVEGSPLPIDLGGEATLCVGQSIMLNAGNNWVSTDWTSTNGFLSGVPVISINDPGLYYLKAIDNIGCIGMDTFKLETSLDLLVAEFLMPSEIVAGDTLVAIDISWPLPDKVEWTYPSQFTLLESSDPDFLFAIAPEAGTYNIGMQSFLAECRDFKEKLLVVLAEEKENPGGRLGYTGGLVQQFSVSPNPNDGRFEVNVLLSEEERIKIQIISFPKGTIEAWYEDQGADFYQVQFELTTLAQGMYLVLLRAGDEQRLLRFVKR